METTSFEEIKELFKTLAIENNKRNKEADRRNKEANKQNKETDKKNQENERLRKEARKQRDKDFQENEKLWKDLREKQAVEFQENEKRWQEIRREVGGIGHTTGKVTEDFFFTALSNSMLVGKLKFDYIDRGLQRKRKNTKGEYDIILYNTHKIMIIEVKYVFRKRNLRQLLENISKFKVLFPEYKGYKKYGTIAAMTFEDGVIDQAKEYGFTILGQNNQEIQTLNESGFEPSEYL